MCFYRVMTSRLKVNAGKRSLEMQWSGEAEALMMENLAVDMMNISQKGLMQIYQGSFNKLLCTWCRERDKAFSVRKMNNLAFVC